MGVLLVKKRFFVQLIKNKYVNNNTWRQEKIAQIEDMRTFLFHFFPAT
jgi:hypothetical protein